VDWYSRWTRGRIRDVQIEFMEVASCLGENDLIFIQAQTPGVLPGRILQKVPGIKLAWVGDLRERTQDYSFDMAPHVISCFSNERDVEAIRAVGHRADFLNIGFTTGVFNPEGSLREGTPEIVFLGSQYPDRFPRSSQRQRIVAELRERYGSRFAVYGNGWGDNSVFLQEQDEAAAYRTCKIAIDANHFDTVSRFTSDRRFRSMGSGAFTLANWHPGIEVDFTPGEHLVTWKDPAEIPGLIDHYLEHEDERKVIAAAGCRHVHLNHSWDARMVELQSIISKHSAVPA
jgi:spore maturation protein CgeB